MEKLFLNLRLFDGAAAGAGVGAAAGAEGAPTDAGQADPQAVPAKREKNPLAHVHYGKQPAQEDGTQARGANSVTTDTAVERGETFEQLIKGEYKDLFHQRVQQIIDERFKATKGLESRMTAMEPMLEALASKYGVDTQDTEKLMKAIEDDDSYFEDEAERRGLTVEQLKEFKRMERENAEFRKTHEEMERRQNSDRIFGRWTAEAESCAQKYPNFSLQAECQSPETGERFLSMLRSGVDVQTAYEVVHKDELLGGAIQYAVQSTQRRTMDSIRARGMRPDENGASGNGAARLVKTDPSKWTRKDREEISRRVHGGERIEL